MSDDSTVDLENGHYSAGSSSDSSERDDNGSPKGDFDTTLPTAHRYLGALDDVGGYTLYDDGQVVPAMLAIRTDTLVFPGFTLPLVIREYEVDHIYEDIRKGYTFALICADENQTGLFDYGVVMEVYETSVKRGAINLKAKGRQRCRIVAGDETRPSWARLQKLTVKVLAEPDITSPLASTQLASLKSRRADFEPSDFYRSAIKGYAKYRRFHLSQYPFPWWVYERNELSYYVRNLRRRLSSYYSEGYLPEDPTSLSYWFVQNYQLGHEERLRILKCGSVMDRLKLELKFMGMTRAMKCGKCGIGIALQKDIFAMSKDGVQSNYCNPGGNVFETITVTDATNFTLEGLPSRQFSWFPGYAWTIMQCRLCRSHLGWQFSSRGHRPAKFYGLANSCLEIQIVDGDRSER